MEQQSLLPQGGAASYQAGLQQMVNAVISEALQAVDKESKRIIQESEQLADSLMRVVAVEFPQDGGRKHKFDKPVHPSLPTVIQYVKVGLLPLLVGPAGSGKSTMAESVAEALDLPYGHLCFSAGVSKVWLFGRHTPTGFKEAEFSKRYREGGVFLADELDAADANVLLAINTALSAHQMYNPMSGSTIKKHKDFHFIGAANTFGKGANSTYVGRNRLDAATLDRFVCVDVDYLQAIEDTLCRDKETANKLRQIREKLRKEGAIEVVSYRSFIKAQALLDLKTPKQKLFKILFASWPEDLFRRLV